MSKRALRYPLLAIATLLGILVLWLKPDALPGISEDAQWSIRALMPFGETGRKLRTLRSHRKIWQSQAPSCYSYGIESHCFCAYSGNFLVTVDDGQVVDVVDAESGEAVYVADYRFFYTIDQHLDAVRHGVLGDAYLYNVTFDDATGIPASVEYDFEKQVIDDEGRRSIRLLFPFDGNTERPRACGTAHRFRNRDIDLKFIHAFLEGETVAASTYLESGADIDMNYWFTGWNTALSWAAAHGNVGRVEFLLARGANPDRMSGSGRTPLMYAAMYGHDDVVEVLLQSGADADAETPDGETAQSLARTSHIVDLLGSCQEEVANAP